MGKGPVKKGWLACAAVVLAFVMTANVAVAAGIRLGPGPKAVLKAYKAGDFDKAEKIMEKWKKTKMKFRTCNTREFTEVYRHLHDRREFLEGTYDLRTVQSMLKNIQRVVDKNRCGK